MQYIKHVFELYISYMKVALVTMIVTLACLFFYAGIKTGQGEIFSYHLLITLLAVVSVHLLERMRLKRLEAEIRRLQEYLLVVQRQDNKEAIERDAQRSVQQ